MPDKKCPEKTRLIENWRKANNAYALMVGELFAQVGRINKSQFKKLNVTVYRARAAAFEARAQLQHHFQQHEC